jgi:hypothetical protein
MNFNYEAIHGIFIMAFASYVLEDFRGNELSELYMKNKYEKL